MTDYRSDYRCITNTMFIHTVKEIDKEGMFIHTVKEIDKEGFMYA